eukprot:UC1_evm2s1151
MGQPLCSNVNAKAACVSPCQWNTAVQECADANGRLSCNHYTGDKAGCSQNNACNYHDESGACNENLDPTSQCLSVQEGQGPCEAIEGCTWYKKGNRCIVAADPCSSMYDEEECANNAQCSYDAESMLCYAKGSKVHCDSRFSETHCHTGADCEWSETTNLCFNTKLGVPCDSITDQVSCLRSSGCSWEDGLQSCHFDDVHIACDRYYEEDLCKGKSDCVWHTSIASCRNSDEPIRCIDFGEGGLCQDEPNCEWKRHRCVKKGSSLECSSIKLMAVCNDQACEWNFNENKCAERLDEHEPSLNGEEPEFHGEEMPVTSDEEEDEKFTCADVTCRKITACPAGQHLAKPDGHCCHRCSLTSRECSVYKDVHSCPAQCTWDPSTYTCHALDHESLCSDFFDVLSCNPERCTWHQDAFACTQKGESPPCDTYYEEKGCPLDRCDFSKDAMACHEKGSTLACSRYHVEESCAAQSRCRYDADAFGCIETDKEFECERYYEEKACAAQGKRCRYIKETTSCIKAGKEAACSVYGEALCGAHQQCRWSTELSMCDVKLQFVPMDCDRYYDKEACLDEASALGCYWHPGVSSCLHKDDEIECNRYYEQQSCLESSECSWEDNIGRCFEKGKTIECDEYYDEVMCPKDRCVWHEDHVYCSSKGDDVPCDRVFEESLCNKMAECKYNKDLMACYYKDGASHKENGIASEASMGDAVTRCEMEGHGNKEICLGLKGCHWYGFSQSCVEDPKKIGCLEITNKFGCNHINEQLDHIDCVWASEFNLCIDRKQTFDCEMIFEQHGCDQALKCGWDDRQAKCRELKVPRERPTMNEL